MPNHESRVQARAIANLPIWGSAYVNAVVAESKARQIAADEAEAANYDEQVKFAGTEGF